VPPRVIRGGAELGRDDLRQRIRARLAEGRLPMPGAEMWVGPGSDRQCAICAATIARTHVEYEIPSGDDWLCVHLACFTLWKSEAVALRLGRARTAPRAAD
jgi:hypothetical protein